MKGLLGKLFSGGEPSESMKVKTPRGPVSQMAPQTYEGMRDAGWAQDSPRDKAREFAEGFDTESSEQVLELQQMLNELGIVDEEGASFKEDAILGSKTMQGLRQLQGRDASPWGEEAAAAGVDPAEAEDWAERPAPSGAAPSSWSQWLFGKSGMKQNKVDYSKYKSHPSYKP